jgi:hypothetical protein
MEFEEVRMQHTWMIPVFVGALLIGCSSPDRKAAFEDSEELRSVDHQQELSTNETPFIVSHVVPVDEYEYVNASESEVRVFAEVFETIEDTSNANIFGAYSLHSVVADDASQNTAGRSDGEWEVGYLNLVQFNESPPYGLDEQLARIAAAGPVIDRLEIAEIPVLLFEQPGSEYSRFTYVWLEHGVQGSFDGADREPMERWLSAYLRTPKLSEHETTALDARLARIEGFGYSDFDTSWGGEMLAPLRDVPHAAHSVVNNDGSLGMLVLAETEDTSPLLEMYTDLGSEVVGETDISGRRVVLLEGFSDGTDNHAFIWIDGGISGGLGTNAGALDSAQQFLEAFLES